MSERKTFKKGSKPNRGNTSKTSTGSNNQQKSAPKKKKTFEDHYFYVGSSKQASDYETTLEAIVNYTKVTFERGIDISESLRKMELVDTDNWIPTRRYSTSTVDIIREREDDDFKMVYKEDLNEYTRRKRVYNDNLGKAYGIIWDRCAKAMQTRITQRTDFESNIYNNPIELLKAIKEHSLNYQEKRYEMSIISDALRALVNTKQKEGESLQDYTRRFKTAREILESQIGGPLQLTKYIGFMKSINLLGSNATDEMYSAKANEQLMAYIYMENADQDKYGSLLKNLNQQKSLDNDQYPKSFLTANNALSLHPFDNHKKKDNKQNNQNNQNKKSTNYNRDEQKSEEEGPVLSFAQLEGKCYCCGKPGHRSPDCRFKDKKPKEEWAINKAQMVQAKEGDTGTNASQTTISSVTNSNSNQNSTTTTARVGWAGIHSNFFNQEELRNIILLDSDSTETIFCNPEYVTNIHESNEVLELGTNGGPMVSTKKCDVPHLGTHWYNEKSITNIISLAHMASKFKVTYDSGKEKAFLVHMPNKIVKFKQLRNGLYGMDPRDPTCYVNNTGVQMATGIVERNNGIGLNNEVYLSARQWERVNRASKLYRALGTPTVDDLKAIIRMNLIRNNVVTTDDVNLMVKVLGPDVAALKGRVTRNRPAIANNNTVEIPEELLEVQKDVTLSIDGITVNSLRFLTTISHNIYYRTAQFVSRPTATVFRDNMREVIAVYKRGKFNVTEIHCDNEFRASMDALSLEYNPPIRMNYSSANEHVPRAERNNRTIKERVRITYHRLPYNNLPRIMVKYMVMEAAKQLNYFPTKHGVSKYFSPRMIIHQENLDYHKHGIFTFGEYVQAHDEPYPKNTNAPRTLDCIYLRPLANQQGGHELLHLQTNSVITRRECTSVKITDAIINQVHALAQLDNMPAGLKITNRVNNIMYDYAWLAGVEDNQNVEEVEQPNDDEESTTTGSESDNDELRDDMDENEIAEIVNENRTGLDNIIVPNNGEPNEQNVPVENNERVDEVEDEIDDNNVEDPNGDDNNEADPDDEDSTYEDSEQEDEELQADESEEEGDGQLRRSSRVRVPNPRYQNVQVNEQTEYYDMDSAKIIAVVMAQIGQMVHVSNVGKRLNMVQTYSLKTGLRKFGDKGKQAAFKEMQQLHNRKVWTPIKLEQLNEKERRRAMESLIFLTEKRDGTIKGRTCANGSTQRSYVSKDEAASPTAATEAILLTGVIEAKQGRDIMTLDVPNAFVQTDIPKGNERIIMKIRGPLVDILCEIDPEMYSRFVIFEKGKKVLYVLMLKALYGMMVASILYYKKFRKDIESIGFVVNPYDICVANRIVNGKQQTLTWHVDDVKSSHVDPSVNDDFHKWCESKYGSEETGHVKVVRGKVHDYLAMILDYSKDGAIKIDMRYYVKDMIDKFPFPITGKSTTPWGEKLFKVDDAAKKLDEERKGIFHTFVMKAMFLCKRGRPDISVAISFLASRVLTPNEGDWAKLVRVLAFLKATVEDVLTLEADDSQNIYWFIDASFAVHADMKSHTGAMMSLGKGASISDSTKQKINSRSSTEAELNAIDDKIAKVLWVKKFLEAQGFKVMVNIIYQDNESTIKLSENGKASSGKRTRHFDIKLFYVTDLIERDEVDIEYCPTEDMVADYFTKPLLGGQFYRFRDLIMNLTGQLLPVVQQECVGEHG